MRHGQAGAAAVLIGALALGASGCGALRQSPPTVTPIMITATPDRPPLPIVATETSSPSPVVQPTSAVALPTQSALRTATPTPPPPASLTPTFTPSPTDTPATPGAVYVPVGGVSSGLTFMEGFGVAAEGAACPTMPPGVFGAIFESDPALQQDLGCPLTPALSSANSAYQPFQNGLMIWVSTLGAQPQPAIYALHHNGAYQRFGDTWVEGVDPHSGGMSAPEGMQEPVRGFGKVWRDNASVRDTLGWALAGEAGGSAQVLMFERGEMVSLSQTGQTYILISGAPGRWTARAGM